MTLTEEDISLEGKDKRSSEGGRGNKCNKWKYTYRKNDRKKVGKYL